MTEKNENKRLPFKFLTVDELSNNTDVLNIWFEFTFGWIMLNSDIRIQKKTQKVKFRTLKHIFLLDNQTLKIESPVSETLTCISDTESGL